MCKFFDGNKDALLVKASIENATRTQSEKDQQLPVGQTRITHDVSPAVPAESVYAPPGLTHCTGLGGRE